ncbi:MAG: aminotransferase class I/II-fold pyridoxal phosphate-dependent enzyme [Acidobacteria bacterium]|nr:aminotransferase class I/II-fold pyridoxal phosphate-dependent enzyme [Acidobacteriota bacterium]
MSLSRRGFISSVSAGRSGPASVALIAARGREAAVGESWPYDYQAAPAARTGNQIRISSNENPLGPGKTAVDALLGNFGQYGRYPFNSRPLDVEFEAAIGKKFNVKRENVVLGAGSGEILRNAVRAFTSGSKALVTGTCSFENCPRTAEQIGSPVKLVALDSKLRLDLDGMAAAAKGAGLVFFCNPNNPTATVHGASAVAEFVKKIRQTSPDTAILIDEAYFDYVTDPSYATAVPLAMENPNVFVTRTFSKAYGMAGLRAGYAIGQPETIKKLARFKMPYNVSVPTQTAAVASLGDQPHIDAERKRNTEVRDFTVKAFESWGYKPTASQGNFIFVDLRRPAKAFRDACAANGVMIGRDFPPYEKTHSRISIGTMEEMQKAVDVFKRVLTTATTTAERGR